MGISSRAYDEVASLDATREVSESSVGGEGSEGSAWERAHGALSRLARRRAVLDAEEGRCLLAALRSAAHVHLGFGTFAEYVERLLGYSPRSTHEKLRVAEALEGLPVLARALEGGALSWSALREVTRVASADTEQEWLAFAQGKTVRQLEDVVAGTLPGEGPSSPRAPSARRRVLRVEVAPETFALFREASAHLRRNADAAFDDDAILLAMARAILGGPTDVGRSSYQVSLSVCSACGRTAQLANGDLVTVGPEIAAMASCDGQHIGNVMRPANDNPRASFTDLAGAAHPARDADADARADIGDVGCCERPIVSSISAPPPEPPSSAHVGTRATQTIPPALRRAVLHRDGQRCRVPGCRSATFLDLHHIRPRSEGGGNDAGNLIGLCCAHHRAVHRGELVVGRDERGLWFRHADGRLYGDVRAPASSEMERIDVDRIDTERKVGSGLRNLGFRDADVRAVLTELRESARFVTTAEGLLREALVRLGARQGAVR